MIRLTLFLALALAGNAVAGSDDIDKINGSITASAGQSYGDLETVNGSIRLENGARTGDAHTVNGSIKAGDRVEAGGLETVNGSIRVGTQARIAKAVETVNGSIFVDRDSRIGKHVSTVNGAIGLVATEVGGGIETVNGDLTVGIGSHVHGTLKVGKPNANWMPVHIGNSRKPRVIIGPDAVVDGELVFEREVVLYVHKSARTGRITGATPIAYDTPRAP